MFVLTSKVTIAGKRFSSINDIAIRRSVFTLGDTAVIKVPATVVLAGKNFVSSSASLTQEQIKIGDQVEIQLGYDGNDKIEFKGYVRNINLKQPLEIECEDQFYMCRQKKVQLTGETTTLEDLLAKMGLKVGHADKLTLKNFSIKNKLEPSVAQVLAKLQADYGLNIFFDLNGKIYACRPMGVESSDPAVKYELRLNVINSDQLIYRLAEDAKIEIKAICIKKDGSKIEAKKGSSQGSSKTIYFYDVEHTKELATLAQAELLRHSYDGYEGIVETFLVPYAQPAMYASIVDKQYSERDGEYYIESVDTTFGRSGGRRKLTLGLKNNGQIDQPYKATI